MERPLAFIIGASGPIGRAATDVLGESHRIAASSRKGAEGLPDLAPQHRPIRLDALDDHSWAAAIRLLPAAPQVVVHCVGDFQLEPLDHMTPDRFDSVIASNLSSAFRAYHHLAPLLRQHEKSCLLYFGLAHGQTVQSETRISAYYAAKLGLASLVKSIAAQEAQHGLSCSLLAPGFVAGSPPPSTTEQEPVPTAQLRGAIQQLTGPLAAQLSGTLLDLSGGWRLR
ncbi:MAG: hypothetical protein CMH55_03095 [Myxococcales bacterium]|nr:hypothetical protein [Myxococcales bacterium]|tara:strand:+ start:126 stop:803 length:678 start_codon:yes stop_codon:yes gene_type:complete